MTQFNGEASEKTAALAIGFLPQEKMPAELPKLRGLCIRALRSANKLGRHLRLVFLAAGKFEFVEAWPECFQ